MSNYHGEIMNITTGRNAVIEDNLAAAGVTTTVTAYNYGHRDARHAAAEIAIEADQRVAELEAQLAAAKAHIKQLEVCVAKLEGEFAINMRVKQSLEIKQRDEFFKDLANNMPDEFGD